MNRDVREAGGSLLVVSQFTIVADCRHGRRPSFTDAADPVEAERLYERFVEQVPRGFGVAVEMGVFRADMGVELVNDGPVTFLLDTAGRPELIQNGSSAGVSMSNRNTLSPIRSTTRRVRK